MNNKRNLTNEKYWSLNGRGKWSEKSLLFILKILGTEYNSSRWEMIEFKLTGIRVNSMRKLNEKGKEKNLYWKAIKKNLSEWEL